MFLLLKAIVQLLQILQTLLSGSLLFGAYLFASAFSKFETIFDCLLLSFLPVGNQTIKSQTSIFLTLFIFHHTDAFFIILKILWQWSSIKAWKLSCTSVHVGSLFDVILTNTEGYFPISMYSWILSDHEYVCLDKAEFLLISVLQWKYQRVNKQKSLCLKSKSSFRPKNNLQLEKCFASFKVWVNLVHYQYFLSSMEVI